MEKEGPYAVETKFGWMLNGPMEDLGKVVSSIITSEPASQKI